jgi:hypothetical protein
MKCRLKTNVIIGGRFVERGSIVDDSALSERLKTDACDYDLNNEVMILRQLDSTVTRPSDDGVVTAFPMTKGPGEVVPRSQIPPTWKENEDFLTNWSPEKRQAVQEAATAAYVQQFNSEPIETYARESYRPESVRSVRK